MLSSGYNLCLENPYHLSQCQGMTRDKSDKVDAIRIADYCSRYSDKARIVSVSDKKVEHLTYLSSERELLVKDKAK